MKRIILMVFTFVIIGILGGSVLSDSSTERIAVKSPSNIMHIDDKEKADSIDFSSKVTDHSAYPGVDIVTEVEEKSAYNMAIHYPQFNDASLNKVITDYLLQSKQEFFSQVRINKVYIKEPIATLNIMFDIYPIVEDVYSIVLSKEQYVGGANGSQNSQIFLVDTSENRLIEQTEILIDDPDSRAEIYQRLSTWFEQSEEFKPYLFIDELKRWTEGGHDGFSNMYINKESIIFKFDKYEVTAGVAGSPEISIPIEEMIEFIADDWKEQLGYEAEEPEIPEVPEQPAQNDDQEHTDKETTKYDKRVALTFDDGPHPIHTLDVLQLLEDYQAKATFFVLGSRVDFYPDITQEIAVRGHEIGNHTWNHKDLTSLTKEEVAHEIELSNERIKNATGQEPTLFRPPYGATNNEVRETIGLTQVMWTVDTRDWESRDPDQILKVVKENVRDGSIILLHDIHATTVEATELILQYLQEEGYQFVTISELNAV